jgi:hypothetical protein
MWSLYLKVEIFVGTPLNIFKKHIKIMPTKFGRDKSILRRGARGLKIA